MLLFKTVRWKNFLSTGNSGIEIELDRSRTTILIGESGTGKSTLLDAISFALFNRPFRNINKGQLVNSVNGRECLVEIEFNVGNKDYLIRRGIKPNLFEIYCNGSLLNQNSHTRDYQQFLETNILQCNFKAFSQIVVLGASNFTPFMQLKPSDRRNIIEGLLDIEVFSVMNVILKNRLSGIKTTLSENEYAIDLATEKIAVHEKYLEERARNREEKINENMDKIEDNKKQIEKIKSINDKHLLEVKELEAKLEFKTDVEKEVNKIISIQSKLNSKIKKVSKEIDFYEEHDECPTCHQEIQQEFKQSEIDKKINQLREYDKGIENAKVSIQKLNDKLGKAVELEDKIDELQTEIGKNISSIDAINQFIKKIARDTLKIKENIKKAEDTAIDELKEKIESLEERKEKLFKERSVHDLVSTLLKDGGVKAKIIKQYLPLINKYTNQFLTAMNFFVAFHIDEEFNETIKSRQRDNFSYENFSEGEKQRIDLALLFTWRKIAKMKNSVNTNLLVLDEVLDSYLDTTATENVLQLINSDMFKNTNVFVISHKESITDKFHANIRFTKKKNFSMIE